MGLYGVAAAKLRGSTVKEMIQVLGMIRYEMLMAWRRGSTRMILFVMLALPVATFIYTSDMWLKGIECMCGPDGEPLPTELVTLMETYATLSATIFVIPILTLIVPVMISDTIPLDRHYGTNQILNSLPLTPASYLLGKLGGALGSVFGALGIGGALWGAVILFRQYRPDPNPLMIFWGGMLMLAMISTVLGVLVPAISPNRRKAVMWGFAAAFVASIFSTMLPVYEVLQASLQRLTGVNHLSPDPLPEIMQPYPDPFSGAFVLNYGIIAVMIVLVLGMVVRRMQTSEAPI
jgi:ABC-type transport system involved in multi-copper enzyme maturation permease subunit